DTYHAGESRSYRQGAEEQTLRYSGGGFRAVEAYDDLELGPFQAPSARFWEVTSSSMNLMMYGEFSFIAGLGPYSRVAGTRQAPDHKAVLSKLLPIMTFSI
ncbi:unnamed protein product, partial [Prorocentrum cordatum]